MYESSPHNDQCPSPKVYLLAGWSSAWSGWSLNFHMKRNIDSKMSMHIWHVFMDNWWTLWHSMLCGHIWKILGLEITVRDFVIYPSGRVSLLKCGGYGSLAHNMDFNIAMVIILQLWQPIDLGIPLLYLHDKLVGIAHYNIHIGGQFRYGKVENLVGVRYWGGQYGVKWLCFMELNLKSHELIQIKICSIPCSMCRTNSDLNMFYCKMGL
jgi:hypothetical protein